MFHNCFANLFGALFFFLTPFAWFGLSHAAQFQLSWNDNSNNEDGFKVERSATGASGTFTQIALTGANSTSLTDSNLTAGTNYCYRVRAYNAGGDSSYTNVACATAAVTTVSLSIAKSGSGGGAVTSAPAGINCGATCTGNFATGTAVALTATPAAGSIFSGWSGDADCADGSVTMNAGTSCAATFQLQSFTVSVALINTITSAGAGGGSVTSSLSGIDCGSNCSASYVSGTALVLTAAPAAGSIFAGWGGACSGTGTCNITVTNNIAATATFVKQSFMLVVDKSGSGKVTSSISGIDCGSTCAAGYPSGAAVTLTPAAASGATFLGWSGGCSGTASCTVTMTADTTVTAAFSGRMAASIGIFRPSTGEWLLDMDGNGAFDGCNVDRCAEGIGQQGDLPVVGAWNYTDTTLLGVFDPATASWYLDLNGNGSLDGCELDTCGYLLGEAGDVPVVGDWTGNGQKRIGVYRPSTRKWYFDINGNGDLDSCTIDICTKSFGSAGDIPVVGDWTGSGKDKIGIFRPSTGKWVLDANGNRTADRCSKDRCFASFGLPGDLPVVGDWNGNGKDKIGVFRPATGEWLLDFNGNGKWDGCDVDACLSFGQSGDLPVVGKW